ncbi:MAG: hypothetical protein ACO3NW_09270, partial [Kiritimatiellia bacterium]
ASLRAAALGAKQLAARGKKPFAFRITSWRKQASFLIAAASNRTPQKAEKSAMRIKQPHVS